MAVAGPALLTNSIGSEPAQAQELPKADPDAQLLLAADELIYDNDNQIITAVGSVQLDYDGYNVVADRVSYNRKTRRVKAYGNVAIIEPDGNLITAQEIDITDDFSEGFVNALRVRTADNTRIAAESAERFKDQKTVFNQGTYTACEPCKDNPEKPPIWQIKAQKVILDGVERTVTYKNASFELFGLPIAYLPYFSHADATVKRKSGFLVPQLGSDAQLGIWGRASYFIETGDSHDLTVSGTHYSLQGFLGQVEWRHQLENGYYTITGAAISQKGSDEFTESSNDRNETDRAMIGSRGRFDINSKWVFGWDVLAQTDNNFSRTYDIQDYDPQYFTNQIFLRGLNDRSFFEAAAKRYLIQNDSITGTGEAFSFVSEQPTVLPIIDYNYVTTDMLTEGEVSLDVNWTSLTRNSLGVINDPEDIPSLDFRTHGFNGETVRVSADLMWKKTFTTDFGVGFTPLLSMRGDLGATEGFSEPSSPANMGEVTEGGYSRFMPTAGLEVNYQILAMTENSSHVFEPIAQIFARPDLAYSGIIPNEDSQSLVFDGSTLFQRDKFSGYDRIESGTRANFGLRYSAQFAGGLSLNAVAGQSIQIAGENPYAREDDLVNVGEESGLEDDYSDYVASLSAVGSSGLIFNTQARFDRESFEIRRTDTTLSYEGENIALSTNYTFIDEQPDYGFINPRQQVGFDTAFRVTDRWKVFGGAQYDMESQTVTSDRFGLSYHDECFTFSLAFNESRSSASGSEIGRSLSFKIGLRTLGDYAGSLSDENFDEFSDNENF